MPWKPPRRIGASCGNPEPVPFPDVEIHSEDRPHSFPIRAGLPGVVGGKAVKSTNQGHPALNSQPVSALDSISTLSGPAHHQWYWLTVTLRDSVKKLLSVCQTKFEAVRTPGAGCVAQPRIMDYSTLHAGRHPHEQTPASVRGFVFTAPQ